MATLVPFLSFREFDSNGEPLAGGLLYSYQAGTVTLKDTYTDATGNTKNTNPVVLDAYGRASVWLGTGSYKFVLRDSDGNIIYTKDNVNVQQDNGVSVNTIDDLRDLSSITYDTMYVGGHTTNGDGGGGWFYWDDTSLSIDDDGCIIKVNAIATGRFKRIITDGIDPKFYGAIADGNFVCDTQFTAADDFAHSNGYDLVLTHGTYVLNVQNQILSYLKPTNGAMIGGSVTLTINGFDQSVNWQVFGSSITVSSFGEGVEFAKPIWFGAVGDGSDETAEIVKTFASCKGVVIDENKNYGISSQITVSGHKIIGLNMFTSTFTKLGNLPYMFSIDNTWGTTIRDINIDANGTNFTGSAIRVSGANTLIDHVNITNCEDTPIKIVADYAENFTIQNSYVKVITANVATKYMAALESGNDNPLNPRGRRFLNVATGGCRFVDFSGMVTTFATDCGPALGAFNTDSNTTKLMMKGCRFAMGSSALNIQIYGQDHQIIGNSFGLAGGSTMTIENNAGIYFMSNTVNIGGSPGYATDSTAVGNTANTNVIDTVQTYTGGFNTVDTPSTIGNGSVVSYVTRNGLECTVRVVFTVGSTTSFGTGDMYFILPFKPKYDAVGHGFYLSASGITYPVTAIAYNSTSTAFLFMPGYHLGLEPGALQMVAGASITFQVTFTL